MLKKIILALACSSPLAASAETITLNVAGMTCQSCAKGVREAFEDVAGVKTVTADAAAQKVVIVTEDNVKVTDAQLRNVIIEQGYSLDKISRT